MKHITKSSAPLATTSVEEQPSLAEIRTLLAEDNDIGCH